jgi:transcription initiation factor TFIIIB Brf1 subunit/transcription initiation factor TFIIB
MKPCGVCGGRNIIYDEDSGENICYDCGCVVGESRESTEPSRKELFGAKHGVGPKLTPLLHDRGVGTLKVGRMSTARERLLSNMLREVAWVSDKLGVGMGVAEMAAEFVRRAVEKGVVRRTLRASAAAAVYLAANHHGLGRTLDDVAKAADIPTTQLAKAGLQGCDRVKPQTYAAQL